MHSPRPSIVFSSTMKWLAAAITIALAYVLYTAVHDVALVFFGAAVFAYIFAPIVDFFAPYTRQSRMLATTLFFLIMAAVGAIIIAQLGPVVTAQYSSLRADLPNALAVIDAWSLVVAGTTIPVGAHIKELLAERVMAIPASLPSLVVGAIHGFLHVLAFLISSFFLMMNGKQLVRTLVNLVPKIHQAEVRYVGGHINGILRGYIRGTLLLIPIMAVLTTIALWLLGVRYALLIGIVSGIVEILPIIGPWSAAAFAIIMAVFQSPLPFGDTVFMVAAVIGAVYFSLRMFEDYVIIPAVVGPAVHLHPILVIAAILAGAEIGGILGLFLAIPFTSIMQYLLRWVYHKLVSSDTLPDGH